MAINEGEMASRARRGYGIHKWVNNKKPGSSETVLTDATLYFNIPEGAQVFIRKAWVLLNTLSDTCCVNLVSCDAVAGGGTATDIDGCMRIHSSASLYGSEHYERDYRVPLVVRYSSGARSVSVKANANDASAEIDCGWNGWYEEEV